MRGLPRFLALFRDDFYEVNNINTRAQVLSYEIKNIFGVKTLCFAILTLRFLDIVTKRN